MTDFEAIVRALLHNAAARQWAAQRAEPEAPSVEYRTGFAAGREAGELAALALVLAELTGESVGDLIAEAEAQASVETSMPFDLHLEVLDGEEAPAGDAGPSPVEPTEADQDLVPCPTCWLPADLLPPVVHGADPRSRCPRGHENTLVPAVLEHLRSLMGPMGPELGQSAS